MDHRDAVEVVSKQGPSLSKSVRARLLFELVEVQERVFDVDRFVAAEPLRKRTFEILADSISTRCLSRRGRAARAYAHRLRHLDAPGGGQAHRTKQRFVEEGLERALSELPRLVQSGSSALLTSLLVAVACSKPGRPRWTLQLLVDELVRLTAHDSVSDETVRRRLDELERGAYLKSTPNSLLALYAEPPDETPAVVCFDEAPMRRDADAHGVARQPQR